jgi:hypothetical protein
MDKLVWMLIGLGIARALLPWILGVVAGVVAVSWFGHLLPPGTGLLMFLAIAAVTGAELHRDMSRFGSGGGRIGHADRNDRNN